MKKVLSVLLVLCLCAGLVVGCSKKQNNGKEVSDEFDPESNVAYGVHGCYFELPKAWVVKAVNDTTGEMKWDNDGGNITLNRFSSTEYIDTLDDAIQNLKSSLPKQTKKIENEIHNKYPDNILIETVNTGYSTVVFIAVNTGSDIIGIKMEDEDGNVDYMEDFRSILENIILEYIKVEFTDYNLESVKYEGVDGVIYKVPEEWAKTEEGDNLKYKFDGGELVVVLDKTFISGSPDSIDDINTQNTKKKAEVSFYGIKNLHPGNTSTMSRIFDWKVDKAIGVGTSVAIKSSSGCVVFILLSNNDSSFKYGKVFDDIVNSVQNSGSQVNEQVNPSSDIGTEVRSKISEGIAYWNDNVVKHLPELAQESNIEGIKTSLAKITPKLDEYISYFMEKSSSTDITPELQQACLDMKTGFYGANTAALKPMLDSFNGGADGAVPNYSQLISTASDYLAKAHSVVKDKK